MSRFTTLCFVVSLLVVVAAPLGAQSKEEVQELTDRAFRFYQQAKYDQALPLARSALEGSMKVHGKVSNHSAYTSWLVGSVAGACNDFEVAKKHFALSLEITEELYGPAHLQTSAALGHLGRAYLAAGDVKNAIPLYQRSLDIKEQVSTPEDLAVGLNNLSVAYRSGGEFQKALPLLERALEINETVLGPDSSVTAGTLSNLGLLYQEMGRFEEALPLFHRALQIRREALGEDHVETATIMNNLSVLFQLRGEYDRALDYQGKTLAIWERIYGPEHVQIALALNNMSGICYDLRDFPQAESLAKRAIAIGEKALGPHHPALARGFNNLATIYQVQGRYQEALALQKRSKDIHEEVYGAKHPDTINDVFNLGSTFYLMGDLEQAEKYIRQVLAARKEVLGENHPDTVAALDALGNVAMASNHYGDAGIYYEQVLSARKVILGVDHPMVAQSLNNVAGALEMTGNSEAARDFREESVLLAERSLGKEHPTTATYIYNLASLAAAQGEHELAETMFERALAIQEKTLGPHHSATASSLVRLGLFHIHVGNRTEALSYLRRSSEAILEMTGEVFGIASERQRFAFLANQRPYDLFATLGSGEDIAREVLRYKGIVLDSVVEDLRRAERSDSREIELALQRLQAVRGQINQVAFEAKAELGGGEKLALLRQELENLQSQLAERGVGGTGKRRAFGVTPAQVQASLPKNSVLVEYIYYGHYIPKQGYQFRYGAMVLPRVGKPIWVPLTISAQELESLVRSYGLVMRGAESSRDFQLEVAGGEDVSKQLLELYQAVCAPVEVAFPAGTTTVVVCPDRALNFVSFASLLDRERRFLAEKYNVSYVSSGRDLLGEEALETPGEEIVLIGAPTFTADCDNPRSTSADLLRAVPGQDWQSFSLSPLPYTGEECERLQAFFNKREARVTFLTGEEASERNVRSLRRPRVLHLATHGYFFTGPSSLGVGDAGLYLQDPMYRNGLALSGAGTTVTMRIRGQNPPNENDGLLTAAEVGTLDLQGTELVTLSACDTGSGEAQAGEGVLGLRRAFVQAGARNLVMTLWPVADKETASFMQDFYALAEQETAAEAMAEVQRDWLMRLREERGIGEAARLAGPFVLTSQGKLQD